MNPYLPRISILEAADVSDLSRRIERKLTNFRTNCPKILVKDSYSQIIIYIDLRQLSRSYCIRLIMFRATIIENSLSQIRAMYVKVKPDLVFFEKLNLL